MTNVIGEILGFAVGIAISPVPIAAVILMLFAARARVTGPAFMIGWIIGITVVATIVSLLPGVSGSTGEPTTTTGVVKGVLGLVFLALAIRQWRSRPAPGEAAPMPRWMAGVDAMGPGAAFGLAILLSAVNPKNLVLAAAAGAAIGAADLSSGETATVIIVFALIASITIVVPVVGFLIAGERIQPTLDTAKSWLTHNNATVMGVLFLVFGVILIGDAISILWG